METDATANGPYPVLNRLITLIVKIPTRILNPNARSLNSIERLIIEKIISKSLNKEDALAISKQIELINYVDRGTELNVYQSFLSRIEGIRTCATFGPLIGEKSEHEFGAVDFLFNNKEVKASLFCANGCVNSLEASQDISKITTENPNSKASGEIIFLNDY